MAKKLYVGNLPYEIKEEELKDLFSKAGTVESVQIITDKYTGRSKGFGFVEMTSDDESDKAIEMCNDTEIGGRKVIVNEARPKREDGR